MGDWPVMFDILGGAVLFFFFAVVIVELGFAMVRDSAGD